MLHYRVSDGVIVRILHCVPVDRSVSAVFPIASRRSQVITAEFGNDYQWVTRTWERSMSDSRDSSRSEGFQSRTRAHRGGGLNPRAGPPGREQHAAETNYRRGWFGWGQASQVEKNAFGVVFTDCYRIAGEIVLLTLPVLWYLSFAAGAGQVGIFNAWLVATAAMVVVGILVRGGWVHPPLTSAPGWVRLFPKLIVLRVGYFNLTLLAVMYAALAIGQAVGPKPVVVLAAAVGGAASVLLFPRVTDEVMARLG